LITALSVSIPLGAITVFLMTIALRAHRSKVMTGEQGLIGETGVVQAAFTPKGKVMVRGALWDAIGPAGLQVGQPIIVKNVHELVLQVEPAAAAENAAMNTAKV
ncbi:MAG: NfeD family protein, partial [Candidatus Angelobacter sp.]